MEEFRVFEGRGESVTHIYVIQAVPSGHQLFPLG